MSAHSYSGIVMILGVLFVILSGIVTKGYMVDIGHINPSSNQLLLGINDDNNISFLPYIGKPLGNLINVTLFTSLRGRPLFDVREYERIDHPLQSISVGLGIIAARYNRIPSNDVVLHYGCGDFVESKLYRNTTLGVVVSVSSYEYCNVTLTSIGYEYFSYMNGKVDTLYVLPDKDIIWLGEYLANYTRMVLEINYFTLMLNATNSSVSVIYAGVGAEEISISHEYAYRVVNNTLTPINNTYIKLVNPYYKFYVVINGVRFYYPIRIGVDNVNGSAKIKFIDMFIPPFNGTPVNVSIVDGKPVFKIINTTWMSEPRVIQSYLENNVITIDREYLEKIVEAFRKATGNNSVTINDIVVADIYYALTDDYEYIVPVLKLYCNTTHGFHEVVYMELYKPGPIVKSVVITAGIPSASDPNVLVETLMKEVEEVPDYKWFTTILSYMILVVMALTALVIAFYKELREK